MRLACLFLIFVGLTAQAQDSDAKRYGHDVEETKYPQKTPDIALKSVAQAIDDGRIDYLMAQLAEPVFVDKRVTEYKSRFDGPESGRTLLAFDQLVKETGRYFRDDPALVRELRRFAKEAEWKAEDMVAVGSVKELPGRHVFMRKARGRWFLDNKQK